MSRMVSNHRQVKPLFVDKLHGWYPNTVRIHRYRNLRILLYIFPGRFHL